MRSRSVQPEPEAPEDLIVAIAETRDRASFSALFGRYAPKIKAYAMRRGADEARADELVQEVMLTIWRKAAMFDPGRAQASAWIFTIARNRWIDHIRREQRPEIDPEDPMVSGEPEPTPDSRLALGEAVTALRGALETLPAKQADLVRTSFFDDKTHRQIADETGLPLGTVKSRIRRALGSLLETMEVHR